MLASQLLFIFHIHVESGLLRCSTIISGVIFPFVNIVVVYGAHYLFINLVILLNDTVLFRLKVILIHRILSVHLRNTLSIRFNARIHPWLIVLLRLVLSIYLTFLRSINGHICFTILFVFAFIINVELGVFLVIWRNGCHIISRLQWLDILRFLWIMKTLFICWRLRIHRYRVSSHHESFALNALI